MSNFMIGPKVYEMHYTIDKRLVIIMEKFDGDCYYLSNDIKLKYKDSITQQVRKMIDILANIELFYMDLKTSNLLYKIVDNKIILRFTDFDYDFCKYYTSLPYQFQNYILKGSNTTLITKNNLLKTLMTVIFCLTPSSSFLHRDLNNVSEKEAVIITLAINQYDILRDIFLTYLPIYMQTYSNTDWCKYTKLYYIILRIKTIFENNKLNKFFYLFYNYFSLLIITYNYL